MTTERDALRADRSALRREYGDLYDRLTRLLFGWDPIGINFEDNKDEYEPEVDTILPRLRTCRSPEDVQRVVYEELCRWFDLDDVGPFDRCQIIAVDIWSEIRGTRWSGEART